MRGLVPLDTTHWGISLVEPPSQGRAQPLLETRLAGVGGVVFTVHFTFTLTADATLYFAHSLLVSGFMSLRFASLPDLISIRQQLFSAPAICSTLALYSGYVVLKKNSELL